MWPGEKPGHRHTLFSDHFVVGGQCSARVACRVVAQIFRRHSRDDAPAFVSSFRTEVDNPVCSGNYIEIVFDCQNRMSHPNQATEDLQKLLDVVEMKSCRRFVKNVNCGGLCGLVRMQTQNLCKLQTLCFAARKGGKRLTELEVVEPHIKQTLQ